MKGSFNILYENIMNDLKNRYNVVDEGGNAFDDVGPIAKNDINPTLDYLDEIIFKPLNITRDMWTAELGSVGKKDFSGDIDIAINFIELKKLFNIDDDKEIRNILASQASKMNVKNRQVGANVHLSFPIKGEQDFYNKNVQIDLFPSTDLDFIKKVKFAPDSTKSKYKGAHRIIALSIIIKELSKTIADDANEDEKIEYVSSNGITYPAVRFSSISLLDDGFYKITKTFKGKNGSFLKNAAQDKSKKVLLTKDFQKVLNTIFGENIYTEDDLYSFETIWNNILMDPNFKYKDKLNNIIERIYEVFNKKKLIIPPEMDEFIKNNNL